MRKNVIRQFAVSTISALVSGIVFLFLLFELQWHIAMDTAVALAIGGIISASLNSRKRSLVDG